MIRIIEGYSPLLVVKKDNLDRKVYKKIQEKHNLTVYEVEDALLSGAIFRHASRGKVKWENIYVAY